MSEALEEARSYRDPVNEDKGFSSQQIKMAYGVLNDPRYKQGNYSGAFKAIEKIAKGLASHPDVANALKRANEELEEETIKEYKKMTVTFRDMATMSKASTDLAKYGFTIDAKGLVMKVDGKGADLNAIGTDIQNFYGATVVAENLEESKIQISNIKTSGHNKAFRDTIKKVLPSLVAYGSDSNPDFLTFVGSKSDLESLATMAKQYKVGPIRENLEEELKVKYDKTKQGWFDDKGRRRYLGNAATNAIMKKKLDHAIKTGDWTSFDVTKEEVEFNFLEEKFTKKDFDKNEDENDHSLNAIMLAKEFGTSQEIKDMEDIDKRHKQRGHINDPDYSKRNALVRKYYPRLK